MDDLEIIDKIVAYTTDMLMEMSTMEEVQTQGEREFRTSGLPFCPILSFLREPRSESYSMSMYTSTGTAIHTSVQTWLAKTKLSSRHLFGNWLCTGCGAKKRMIKKPKPCSCSSRRAMHSEFHRRMQPFWMYEEIDFEYRGLSGHIDLVYWPEPEFAFAVDFKTTDLVKKKKSSYWEPAKPSSPNYVVQIRTYNTVLDLLYGLPIKGWVLANLDRAQPIKKPTDFSLIPSEWSHAKSLKWDRILLKASNNNKRLLRLERAINEGNGSKSRKYLQDIIEHRPCISDSTYNNWMFYGFYKGECELKRQCLSCNTTKIRNAIYTKLEDLS